MQYDDYAEYLQQHERLVGNVQVAQQAYERAQADYNGAIGNETPVGLDALKDLQDNVGKTEAKRDQAFQELAQLEFDNPDFDQAQKDGIEPEKTFMEKMQPAVEMAQNVVGAVGIAATLANPAQGIPTPLPADTQVVTKPSPVQDFDKELAAVAKSPGQLKDEREQKMEEAQKAYEDYEKAADEAPRRSGDDIANEFDKVPPAPPQDQRETEAEAETKTAGDDGKAPGLSEEFNKVAPPPPPPPPDHTDAKKL